VAFTNFSVSKLTPHIGAEIHGIDVSGDVEGPVLAELKQALTDNLVIFFRDQSLTIDQHKAFGRKFGELFIHPATNRVDGHPELIPVKADENSTKVSGETWHTDTSCDPAPPMGSILHMHVVPPAGGDTLFASMYAAYDGLSESMKMMLAGLSAHHSGNAFRGFGYDKTKSYPEADHPVVCRHPESGRKLLFVNRFYTTHINELPRQEGDEMLQFLYRHIETPEFQCRFRWYPNSIAFWDNRCTQHRAIFDYHPQRRSGLRIQIEGAAPVAAA
jgi:taurine dioxygenase